jgi:hypothetical protein
MSYASKAKSTGDTRLGIMSQPEFEFKAITKQDFEDAWKKAVS